MWRAFSWYVGRVLELGVVPRLGEAGAGLDRRPEAGMVQAQVPGPRASHREAAEDDPPVVDRIVPLDRLDRLEDVGLAGPAVGVVGPAEDVERDLARRIGRGGLAVVRGDEPDLVQGRAPAVEHDVEPDAVLRRQSMSVGDDHRIGLERAVDLRLVAPDRLAAGLGPGRRPPARRGRAPDPASGRRASSRRPSAS